MFMVEKFQNKRQNYDRKGYTVSNVYQLLTTVEQPVQLAFLDLIRYWIDITAIDPSRLSDHFHQFGHIVDLLKVYAHM